MNTPKGEEFQQGFNLQELLYIQEVREDIRESAKTIAEREKTQSSEQILLENGLCGRVR